MGNGTVLLWYDMGSAGYCFERVVELERRMCGEKKEAGLGLGSSLSYVVNLVGAKSSYFSGYWGFRYSFEREAFDCATFLGFRGCFTGCVVYS